MSSIKRKRGRDEVKVNEEIHFKSEEEVKEPETSKPEEVRDEYEKDSSDEEDVRNTIGNVPLKWYDEYDHIGYDVLGKKIAKSKKGDEIDEFLEKNDNPDYWRTVKDPATGQDVILTDEQVNLVENIVKGRYTESSIDPYEVGQMVDAIKSGRMKMSEEGKDEESDDEELEEKAPTFYQLWSNDSESEATRRYRQYIPAPKIRLPGHAESYNPPPEYLFDEKERKEWEEMEPSKRRLPFIPQKYSSLREVPGYRNFTRDRFTRCLDLYLLPRQIKMRANVRAEDLLPKLPHPRDLQPFPTKQSMVYIGHAGPVLCISVEPSGHRLASGSSDNTLRIWNVCTGRCLSVIKLSHAVKDIAWNPNDAFPCIAAAVNNEIILIKADTSSEAKDVFSCKATDSDSTATSLPITWLPVESGPEYGDGIRLKITHPKVINKVVWHKKGDYFAVVMPDGQSLQVIIHQLSKHKSQNPLKKPKDLVQTVLFHPSKPIFFVATQRYVKQYDLMKQQLMKKLLTNCQWVSSLDVHPGGDNLIIGSYDKRLSWFDLSLSVKPYKTLRYHQKAIRQVCYHKTYPLFASASDDGTVNICHATVYNDFTLNPLIVPVKVLKGHKVSNGLGVLDCEFHPKNPWIFSAGADCTVRLFH